MGWLVPLLVFGMLAAPALRLARTNEIGVAERAIAGFFLASAAGFSLRLLAVSDGAIDSAFEVALNAGGHLALSLACLALFVFTRRVFRPAAAWAARVQHAGSVASLATFAVLFLDNGLSGEDANSVLLANALRTASYGWCFYESLRYWNVMNRRVEIGLAEPLVANRFGLWAIWTGSLCATLSFVLAMRLLGRLLGMGMDLLPRFLPIVQLAMVGFITASMIAIWLSFFPPLRYRNWVERRATAA